MSATTPAAEQRPIGRMAGTAVLALIAGFGVLQVIQHGIELLWEDTPDALGDGPPVPTFDWNWSQRPLMTQGDVISLPSRLDPT